MVVDAVAKNTNSRNANFYGGLGDAQTGNVASLVDTMWWDLERIEGTVTRQFVLSKLRPNEQFLLDQQVGFGDGLTDHTYLEWIQEKSKRIFLILCDLGVPDQIFGVIDDSWDDDDLPIRQENIEKLKLTFKRDMRLEQKFFKRQFTYLLRNFLKGDHIDFTDDELVPLDLVDKRSLQAKTPSSVDQLHLPGRPDDVFLRRRIPLGLVDGKMPREEYLAGIYAMKNTEHPHLMSLWASYTHYSTGFVLLQPVCASTLKVYLVATPPSIKILAKTDRRLLLVNWLHCLSSAVAFLHSRGLSHRKIKPSNVMFDIDNDIFLGDSGIFNHDPTKESSNEKETYDYASPEQIDFPLATTSPLLPLRTTSSRKLSSADSTRKSFMSSSSTASTIKPSISEHHPGEPYIPSTKNPTALTIPVLPNSDNQTIDPQKSDIFSLACVFLDVITLLLKRSPKSFSAHRSTPNKMTPARQPMAGAKRANSLPPDTSFHGNLSKVDSWIRLLGKDASRKEDNLFRGINPILSLISRMLNPEPTFRPSAKEVESRLLEILLKISRIQSPNVHCGVGGIHIGQGGSEGNWDFGFQHLSVQNTEAGGSSTSPSAGESSASSSFPGSAGSVGGMKARQGSSDREYISGYSGRQDGMADRGDAGSIMTKASGSGSKSSDGRSGVTGSSSTMEMGKVKPKAKAWKAPVYAGMFAVLFIFCQFFSFPSKLLVTFGLVSFRFVSFRLFVLSSSQLPLSLKSPDFQ